MIKRAAFLLTLGSAALAQEPNLLPKTLILREEGVQSDFPALTLDAHGTPWVAYVAWDSKQDTLSLAKAGMSQLSQTIARSKL